MVNIAPPEGGVINPIMDSQSWAIALLNQDGDPITNANVNSLMAWANREGGHWHNTARFNPINTTQEMPGSTAISGNSAGVQAYTSWQQGIDATLKTLHNGRYNDILAALKSGQGLMGMESYPGLYTWSGHSYSSLRGSSTADETGAGVTGNSNSSSDSSSGTGHKLWVIHGPMGINIDMDPLIWGGVVVLGSLSLIAGAGIIAVSLGVIGKKEMPMQEILRHVRTLAKEK